MRLRPDNPALTKAVTIHPKRVVQPDAVSSILKSVAFNTKLGKGGNVISKGHWSGMPMYQLSLEERATCPDSCKQWDNCYGNGMHGAHRIDHRHPEFYERLDDELRLLTRKYKHGVVVRLHVLGDFVDEQYARWWQSRVDKYPNLHVFGYTAHTPDSPVGSIIARFNDAKRVWVRFSNAGDRDMAANVNGPGIPCPEQTNKTESCLTCGICWSTTRPVNFKEH